MDTKEKYTTEHAFERVMTASVGSLAREYVTLEYLFKLRVEIAEWLEKVDEAILKWPDSGKWWQEEVGH